MKGTYMVHSIMYYKKVSCSLWFVCLFWVTREESVPPFIPCAHFVMESKNDALPIFLDVASTCSIRDEFWRSIVLFSRFLASVCICRKAVARSSSVKIFRDRPICLFWSRKRSVSSFFFRIRSLFGPISRLSNTWETVAPFNPNPFIFLGLSFCLGALSPDFPSIYRSRSSSDGE